MENIIENKVISARDIQRNYRKLINRVKNTRVPLFLGARLQPEAVLLGFKTFNDLQGITAKKKDWKEVKKTLDWISDGGKQIVSLAKFIHEDRKKR